MLLNAFLPKGNYFSAESQEFKRANPGAKSFNDLIAILETIRDSGA